MRQKEKRLRQSLYTRALLFSIVGGGALTGAILMQSHLLMKTSLDWLIQERVTLARILGTHVERTIKTDLQQVAEAACDAGDPARLHRALSAVFPKTIFQEALFVLDPDRSIRASYPPFRPETLKNANLDNLFGQGLAGTALFKLPHGDRHALLFVSPVKDCPSPWGTGYVGGLLNPVTSNLLASFPATEASTLSFQLVDAEGFVVAASQEQLLFEDTDHQELLRNAVRDRKPVRGRCHSCHAEADSEEVDRRDEILAFSPLSTLPLGIAVRQEEAEALLPAFQEKRRLLFFGLTFLALFLIFVALAVYSVANPVLRLTALVRGSGGRKPAEPLPSFGSDEVGELALALNAWRSRVVEHEKEAFREKQRKDLLAQILNAQEEERLRIARDLHDSIAQDLAAHRLRIERLEGTVNEPALRDALTSLEGDSLRMLETVREILIDLRPSVLDVMGFRLALQWYLERAEREDRIKGRLEVNGAERALDRAVAIALFRIFQECLQNVIAHSKAEGVLVLLAYGERELRMSIEDDGQGFDPEEILGKQPDPLTGRGFGLLGIRERTELLGGSVRFTSTPSEGTLVTITVPLGPERESK